MDSRKNAFRSKTPVGEPDSRVTNGVSRTCRSLYMCIRHCLYTIGTVLYRTVRVLKLSLILCRIDHKSCFHQLNTSNSFLTRHEPVLAPISSNVLLCTITRSRPEYCPVVGSVDVQLMNSRDVTETSGSQLASPSTMEGGIELRECQAYVWLRYGTHVMGSLLYKNLRVMHTGPSRHTGRDVVC